MSKEVADQLRKARALIATPRQWITGIAEDHSGGQTRYCLGGAICQTLHGTPWQWLKGGAAFDVITAAILKRHPQYEKEIMSYYREHGMEPTVIISRFNNTNPEGHTGVLTLLEAVIAELDPPKVPKPEGEQENAEPDQFDQPEEPDDPADDEGEPEAIKVRELEYA